MTRPASSCSFLATVLLLCGCMAGCPQKTPEEVEKEPEPWQGEMKIVQGEWKDLKELIDRNKGKVIVADLWTTWSRPSIREIPHLVELQKKYGDRIVCIAVNVDHALDKPKPSKEEVQKMETILRDRFGTVLEPNDAFPGGFPLFVSTQPDESFQNDGEFDYPRSILIYDRAGERTVIDLETAEARLIQEIRKKEEEERKKNKNSKSSVKTKKKKKTLPNAEIRYEKDVIPIVEKLLG